MIELTQEEKDLLNYLATENEDRVTSVLQYLPTPPHRLDNGKPVDPKVLENLTEKGFIVKRTSMVGIAWSISDQYVKTRF